MDDGAMSVLANVMVEHSVPDFRNLEAVVELLQPTVPVLLEVREFWRRQDTNSGIEGDKWYSRLLVHPQEGDFLRYYGPGGFEVGFGARVAIIGAACRWSGFLSIPEMQEVHLKGFREVARVLGGKRMVAMPELDWMKDVAEYDGAPLMECISVLERTVGPPLPDRTVYFREPLQYRPQWFVEDVGL